MSVSIGQVLTRMIVGQTLSYGLTAPRPLFYALLCDAGTGILHTTFILYQFATYWVLPTGDRETGRQKGEETSLPFQCARSSVSITLARALCLTSRKLFPVSRFLFFFQHSQNQVQHVFSKITELARLQFLLRGLSPNSTRFFLQVFKSW